MTRIALTPQAISYFGVIEVPKEDVAELLDAEWQQVKRIVPKFQKKGFRTYQRSRGEAEKEFGVGELYAAFWREWFIHQMNVHQGRRLVCYVDEIELSDRGPFYALSSMIYFFPVIQFASSYLEKLQKDGVAILKDRVLNERRLRERYDQLRMTHYQKVEASDTETVQLDDLIEVEIQSELSRGFAGQPAHVVWEVDPAHLPKEHLSNLIGRQRGQSLILTLPIQWTPQEKMRTRMSIRITNHWHKQDISDAALVQMENLASVEALREREWRTMEAQWEKQKSIHFMNDLVSHAQIEPIPKMFILGVAIRRAYATQEKMGREFQRKYQSPEQMAEQIFPQVMREFAGRFLCWGLCETLKICPIEEELHQVFEAESRQWSEELATEIYLRLCVERVLQKFLDIEPPIRSVLDTTGRMPPKLQIAKEKK